MAILLCRRVQSSCLPIMPAATFFLALALGTIGAHAEWKDGVETAMCASELVVFGRLIPPTQLGHDTKYTLAVETYFKGSGPNRLVLIISGGIWTDETGRKLWSNNVSGVDVKEGEEVLAFLQPSGDGYRFTLGASGKYTVETDPETAQRIVKLRWHKKRYMRGEALEAFEKIEKLEEDPNRTVRTEAKLDGVDGLYEDVLVRDLVQRLREVLEGENSPHRCIPDKKPVPTSSTAGP